MILNVSRGEERKEEKERKKGESKRESPNYYRTNDNIKI